MRKQAKRRILASFTSAIMAASMFATIPSIKTPVVSAASEAAQYELRDNVQDGVILHAWNWSYSTIKSHLKEIAEAGYSTIQTSPVQQPKDYSASYTDVNGQWWKFYQPVSFSIAQNSWLGTANDLKELCTEADKYGIKIICDIVSNHLANGSNRTELGKEVAYYEPTIYNNYNTYVHPYREYSEQNPEGVVLSNLGWPDLNTANSYIQEKVIDLLKQCIDCGVDGFRFDAAKHIETSTDGWCASNFWNNVIGSATAYAKETKNISLYCYGEILDNVGNGRNLSSYTDLMSITDNGTGNDVRENVKKRNAAGAASSYYKKQQKANKVVLWAESHDTYNDKSSLNTSVSELNETWAIVASRADASALYFVRPGNASMGQCGTTNFKDKEVVAVNKFHNYFVGAKEYLSSYNQFAMNERYFDADASKSGAVIVNVNGGSASVSGMKVNRLANGEYEDKVTGNTFTVSNGTISGNIGDTGVAVLYNKITKPVATISQKGGTFTGSLTLTFGLQNAKSGTYKVGETGQEVSFINSTTTTIGETMEDNESVTVYLTATDGTETTSEKYTFTKTPVDQKETVKVYFSNNYRWGSVYAYFWGGKNPSNAWPGNQMTYVGNNEYNEAVYSIDVPTDVTGLVFTNGSGAQTKDITSGIAEGAGFYISGGSSNAYNVGTYKY